MSADGDDYLAGESGADFISAGSGNDVAVGGDDYDKIYGGPGEENNQGEIVSRDGNDKLYASSMDVQLPVWPQTCEKNGEFPFETGPVETGEATWGDQQPPPGAGKSNFLFGDSGYDVLVGSNRIDLIQGDEQGDDLYGFGGADFLRGDRASDCLSGGPDPDGLNDSGPVPEPDPNNPVEPDDVDTLWGGGSVDTLNAKDGDALDTLRGGGDFNSCTSDQGDGMSTLWFLPSICF